jgi:hypothetical protein
MCIAILLSATSWMLPVGYTMLTAQSGTLLQTIPLFDPIKATPSGASLSPGHFDGRTGPVVIPRGASPVSATFWLKSDCSKVTYRVAMHGLQGRVIELYHSSWEGETIGECTIESFPAVFDPEEQVPLTITTDLSWDSKVTPEARLILRRNAKRIDGWLLVGLIVGAVLAPVGALGMLAWKYRFWRVSRPPKARGTDLLKPRELPKACPTRASHPKFPVPPSSCRGISAPTLDSTATPTCSDTTL